MIAFLADRSHRLAINPWVRAWLRIRPIWRLLIVWAVVIVMIPIVMGMLVFISFIISVPGLGFAGALEGTESLEALGDALGEVVANFMRFCFCGSCCTPQVLFGIPFGILIFETIYTNRRIASLRSQHAGILATKAEYLGAYPPQPHSRFVYLVLAGTRSLPEVIMVVGKDTFKIPVVDVVDEGPRATPSAGETSNYPFLHWVAATFGAKANFVIRYAGEAGRIYGVEFGSFYDGPIGAQKWVNFIVSTRYQAETGETPYDPWASLPEKSRKSR